MTTQEIKETLDRNELEREFMELVSELDPVRLYLVHRALKSGDHKQLERDLKDLAEYERKRAMA